MELKVLLEDTVSTTLQSKELGEGPWVQSS